MAADPQQLARLSDRLTALMRDKLGVRADSLRAALRRAGRKLPRRLRQDGEVILAAIDRSRNPRLARVTDGEGPERAARRIEAYLAGLDPAADRARARAYLFADLAFRLAVVIALVIGVLAWRGYV
jgi:IS5 family transposase